MDRPAELDFEVGAPVVRSMPTCFRRGARSVVDPDWIGTESVLPARTVRAIWRAVASVSEHTHRTGHPRRNVAVVCLRSAERVPEAQSSAISVYSRERGSARCSPASAAGPCSACRVHVHLTCFSCWRHLRSNFRRYSGQAVPGVGLSFFRGGGEWRVPSAKPARAITTICPRPAREVGFLMPPQSFQYW